MYTKKEKEEKKSSFLMKKIRERIKRSKEPFKGTLGTFRGIPSREIDNEPQQEEKREAGGDGLFTFKEKLREAISSNKEPFFNGTFGRYER